MYYVLVSQSYLFCLSYTSYRYRGDSSHREREAERHRQREAERELPDCSNTGYCRPNKSIHSAPMRYALPEHSIKYAYMHIPGTR
jgi:hypothetical protein